MLWCPVFLIFVRGVRHPAGGQQVVRLFCSLPESLLFGQTIVVADVKFGFALANPFRK